MPKQGLFRYNYQLELIDIDGLLLNFLVEIGFLGLGITEPIGKLVCSSNLVLLKDLEGVVELFLKTDEEVVDLLSYVVSVLLSWEDILITCESHCMELSLI